MGPLLYCPADCSLKRYISGLNILRVAGSNPIATAIPVGLLNKTLFLEH